MDFVAELYLVSHIHVHMLEGCTCPDPVVFTVNTVICFTTWSSIVIDMIGVAGWVGVYVLVYTHHIAVANVYAPTRVCKGSTISQATFGESLKCFVCPFWCLMFKLDVALRLFAAPKIRLLILNQITRPGWTWYIIYNDIYWLVVCNIFYFPQ